MRSLGEKLAGKAQEEATALAESSVNPPDVLQIVLRLARRQFYDLGREHAVVLGWERLPAAKRNSLWSETANYWEYLALVVSAYGRIGQLEDARSLAARVIDGEAASATACIHVGTAFANLLITKGKREEALRYFRWIVQEQPTHRLAAEGWSWLMIEALQQGKGSEAKTLARRVRQCFTARAALLREWRFDARALLVLHDGNVTAARTHDSAYATEFLEREWRAVQKEVTR